MLSTPKSKLPPLTEEEREQCAKAFKMFDKDGSGTIDIRELRAVLNAMGQHPSDEELFVMVTEVDEDGSKEIDFNEFVKAIQLQKAASAENQDECETIDAFVALGGNHDMSGTISTDKLRAVVEEFELNINLDKLIKEVDRDLTGQITYAKFKLILAGGPPKTPIT